MAEKIVKVKVNAPFRVVNDGVAYSDGDELDVSEDTAKLWERSGFVKVVKDGK